MGESNVKAQQEDVVNKPTSSEQETGSGGAINHNKSGTAFRFRCENIDPSTSMATQPGKFLHLKGYLL